MNSLRHGKNFTHIFELVKCYATTRMYGTMQTSSAVMSQDIRTVQC